MKKSKKNLFMLLAGGLLLMNGPALVNLLFNAPINVDLVDFMKGMGMPIILLGAYHLLKMPSGKRI